MLKEFKEFAMRGNVVDMAVGIVTPVASADITNRRLSICPLDNRLAWRLIYVSRFFITSWLTGRQVTSQRDGWQVTMQGRTLAVF